MGDRILRGTVTCFRTIIMVSADCKEITFNYLMIRDKLISNTNIDHIPFLIVVRKHLAVVGEGCLNVKTQKQNSKSSSCNFNSCRKSNCDDQKISKNNEKAKCFGAFKVQTKCFSSSAELISENLKADSQKRKICSIPFLEKSRLSRAPSVSKSEDAFTVEPPKSKFFKQGRCRVANNSVAENEDSNSEIDSQVSNWSGFRESMIETTSLESFSTLEKGLSLDLDSATEVTPGCETKLAGKGKSESEQQQQQKHFIFLRKSESRREFRKIRKLSVSPASRAQKSVSKVASEKEEIECLKESLMRQSQDQELLKNFEGASVNLKQNSEVIQEQNEDTLKITESVMSNLKQVSFKGEKLEEELEQWEQTMLTLFSDTKDLELELFLNDLYG